ncbi:efflux RND transporter permease subunit [Algiphilus aromaticivorans]|uniref:efflux RND transporter permease subunit n=1 Tax=Algiphilus aromaticivorans TaxID=382454 RepID=UPI0005C14385|nr:efflux RND transporter permease subunit [Algiphilus aromaticivorans]
MNLPAAAVARPVTTVMVVLIAVLLGAIALTRIPVDLLPDIESPVLNIQVEYANAAPQTMEELVTRVIEQAVASTPGLEEMRSESKEGESEVTLRFAWGTDIDVASNDVRDRLFSEVDELPEDAGRPRIRKFDSADTPIMLLGISSPIDPVALRRLIDNRLLYRIQQVPGVAAAETWGGPEREIQVNLDIDKVEALELSLVDVGDALEAANRNLPAGSIELQGREIRLRTPGRIASLDELRATVVAERAGEPITVGDIASVADTQMRENRLIRINDEAGVRMAVRKQSGANTVEVSQRILDEVERLNEELPQVAIMPFFDSAGFIERAIANVTRSLLYGSVLAVLVLMLFLGNPRATMVIATAIPVSLISTFALIYFSGFTINLMTLGGLALGVGLMVDSAIVVLENIMRRRQEDGEGLRASAERGGNEVAAAIVASTLTTLAIFIPMLFATEIAGQLFRELAVVVAFALACALMVALTLVPMLTARYVPAGGGLKTRWLQAPAAAIARRYAALQTSYRDALEGALARPRRVVAVVVLLFAGAVAALPLLGSEFMPASDEGEVRVDLEMPLGTTLEIMDRQTRRAEAIIREVVPERRSMVTSVESEGGTEADIRIELPPTGARERSSAEVAAALREAVTGLPDTTVRVRVREPFFLRWLSRGLSEGEALGVEVRGYDFATLDRLTEQVRETLTGIDGITDLRVPRTGGEPQRLIVIDRGRAADLGVSVESVGRTVETAIAGNTSGYFLDQGDEVRILLKLAENRSIAPERILDLPVPARNGRMVPLGAVAELREASGPVEIQRENQQRMNVVFANIAGRDLGSVAEDVQAALAEIPRPANYELALTGEYEAQQAAFGAMALNVALALLLVYMVMACLYESLRDPVIVMVTVPMALIGVVVMLLATGTALSAQSLVGCLMLIGIVVNNAILIVDQANLMQGEGRDALDAVREAGRRRLRPILMTAATTILALVPLAVGVGEGADAQAPLARAVIGGLISSTLITLIIIPVVYAGFHGAWPARGAKPASAVATSRS